MNPNSKVVIKIVKSDDTCTTEAYAGNMNSKALLSHLKWLRSDRADIRLCFASIDGEDLLATSLCQKAAAAFAKLSGKKGKAAKDEG